MGRLDEAAAVLERGLSLAPDAADLNLELGYVHLKRNGRAEARALFLQVLAGRAAAARGAAGSSPR